MRIALNALEPILNSFGVNPLIRNPLVSNVVTSFIADVLEQFGIYWDPAAGMLNGLDYEYYADATQPMWYLARGLELIGDTMQMTQNPAQAVQYMLALAIFDWPTHIAQLGTAITQSPLLLAAAGGAMALPAASAGGLAGLAGLTAASQPVATPLPGPEPSTSLPIAGLGSPPPGVAAAPDGCTVARSCPADPDRLRRLADAYTARTRSRLRTSLRNRASRYRIRLRNDGGRQRECQKKGIGT